MKLPWKSITIEGVYPELDSGRYAVKRREGDVFEVYADIFKDGHDPISSHLLYRRLGEKAWKTTPMTFIDNDRWGGQFTLKENAVYEYTIEAYPIHDKKLVTRYDRTLEVVAERERACTAAWYEMWPRSQGTIDGQSATFKDMEKRLPEIRGMGFDVVYLTPIHPIGRTNRKGRNNALKAGPNDPGCPYAVGNEDGGHKAVEPSLGTMKEFEHFVKKANSQGMDVALDIVLTCSPDHPYVKAHPDWFYREKDGTIKFAENPPKKYEDIYPFNFYSKDWKALWDELRSIFEFWIKKGVKTFRVDNPHTKPVYFWNWLIRDIKRQWPETVFLSEAFTKPKMMRVLAKAGYTQSYTYFTWRNTKWELTEYLTELTQSDMKEYFQGNFFTNTPDILPAALQTGGRPNFKIRAALAATLSPLYGIYNGFELCENTAIPGKEEYLNSEKYEFKVWDWDRKGNIKDYITKLNKIRRDNPLLQTSQHLTFFPADNDNVLFYGKIAPDGKSNIFVAVNLDPFHSHESSIRLPTGQLRMHPNEVFRVEELLTGRRHLWKGESHTVTLDPQKEPVQIYRIKRWTGTEDDYDVYGGS
ncbi:MAG TPA: DUF3416 domain-containing protein [Elusimicrobiota bacterium]|nr:DUF3416 domain-containing protein [Elusimicrobiota bacterium]